MNRVVRAHAPRINRALTQIIGCTCGWRTPPGTANSDDTYSMHLAIVRAAESAQR